MSFREPQTPGLGGLNELTTAEEVFLQNLAGISYSTGDILYYNGTALVRLGIGSASQVLTVSGGVPSWQNAGGGGSPGGSSSQLQYNNSSAFGGVAAATYDGTNLSLVDNNLLIVDNLDATKKLAFQVSGITTGTTRTVTIPDASGTMTLLGNASTGSGSVVLANSPTLVTPVIGVATATSVNKLSITAPATGATLTIADGKTLTVNHSLTFAGTDSTTMTFPATSKTIAANDASNWALASQATGDLLYASGAGAYTRLAAVAVGSVLVSGGVGTAPAWSASPQLTTIELGNASDTTLSRSAAGVLAVEGVDVPTVSSTSTLTNKRITKRSGSTASSATPTINTDNIDYYEITALAAAITSFTTNLSGTPTAGQTLWIAITDNGTARAITWGSSFESSGNATLPTTTVISTRLDVGLVWNSATSKWRCVAVA